MAWADANYNHKKQITIDKDKVAGDETDFPILISITDADLTGCRADGYDIKFYNAAEDTQLKHERQRWNNGTGELIAWVKIPSLSSITDTIIYMYYEYAAEAIDQADPENVWDSNYVMVLHMHGANANAIDDSTSNNNDVTGSNGCSFQQAGKIGYCVEFVRGSSEYLEVADSASLDTITDELTMEFWMNLDTIGNGNFEWILGKYDTDANERCYVAQFKQQAGNDYLRLYGSEDGGTGEFTHIREDDQDFSFDSWYHTMMTLPSGNNKDGEIYLDGTDAGTTEVRAEIDSIHTNNVPFTIACEYDSGGHDDYFSGKLDEIRLSKVDRGSNWASTAYESQSTPTTFLSFGAEQTGGTNWEKSLSESLTLSESIVKEIEINKSDSITITESTTKEIEINKSDSFTISDSLITKLGVFFKLPLKSIIKKRWKYNVVKTQRNKYRKKDGKKYKYKIKEE